MRYPAAIIMGIVLSACGLTALGPVGSVSLPGDADWDAPAHVEGDAPAWTESRERIVFDGEQTPERVAGTEPQFWFNARVVLPSDPEWNEPGEAPITDDTRRAELEPSSL